MNLITEFQQRVVLVAILASRPTVSLIPFLLQTQVGDPFLQVSAIQDV